MTSPTLRTVAANDLEFTVLEAGSGPLALCLHGFPDTAHTWRHLLPALADAGFHAVAPFTRGYAPTSVPADGRYDVDARAADAVALHEALGGGSDAVLIGHDWGASTTYTAAAMAPERWQRLVAMSVPPRAAAASLFLDYEQLQRSFYMFVFQTPLGELVVSADDMAFIDRLWADWSPGYDATADLAWVKDALRAPENLTAALGYYRALFTAATITTVGPQPTLYLHGADDGCVGAGLVGGAVSSLAAGSRAEIVPGTGHFLHLEAPDVVNALIVDWLR